MQNPIEFPERLGRAESGGDGIDFRLVQPGVQGADPFSHLDAVVDVGFGLTVLAQPTTVARPIYRRAHVSAVDALDIGLAPSR